MKGADWYVPLPFTVAVEVARGAAEQNWSVGPWTKKVMVPVGLSPPARTAVSKICPPTPTGPEAALLSTVRAFSTMTAAAGSVQAVGPAAVLSASPL